MKIWPRDDTIRKTLKHPTGGGFREGMSTPAEWPRDQFTTRRIQDGSVVLQQPTGSAAAKKPVVKETTSGGSGGKSP